VENTTGTAELLASELDRACERPDVVVDLSHCTFIDSTVMARLLSASRKQLKRDGRVKLVIPTDPSNVVERVAQLSRLEDLLVIHQTREAALSSMEHRE
jgi:anti-anti-sigma factor